MVSLLLFFSRFFFFFSPSKVTNTFVLHGKKNCKTKPSSLDHKQLRMTMHTVPSNVYCANVMHVPSGPYLISA